MTGGKTALGLALLAWSILQTQLANSQELLPEDNAQLYTEAVHVLGGNRNLSVRWQSDIRYAVVSDGDSTAESHVQKLFDELEKLTGIHSQSVSIPTPGVNAYLAGLSTSPQYSLANCEQVAAGHCPNFVVVITSQQTMHQISTTLPLRPVFQNATAGDADLHCFFSPGVTPRREIRQGFVFVDSALGELMLQTCLQEEIYQSFGLFNDYTNSTFFSFNNVVLPKIITRYDRALMASLYDLRFPAGTQVSRIALHMIARELEARKSLLAEGP